MSVAPDVQYRLRSGPSLHWATWHDEYVVFDEASGQTHQLDAVRAYVLHLLNDGPQGFSVLSHALSMLPTAPNPSAASEILITIFIEFEASGLVEVSAQ